MTKSPDQTRDDVLRKMLKTAPKPFTPKAKEKPSWDAQPERNAKKHTDSAHKG